MKKFDILRYLRRFFALVLAVTMAGTVVVKKILQFPVCVQYLQNQKLYP